MERKNNAKQYLSSLKQKAGEATQDYKRRIIEGGENAFEYFGIILNLVRKIFG